MYPQNFAMSIKQSLHMPIKFCHIHHEHIHLSLQYKFFTMPILPKSKPKFIQQHHNLPTLSKFHKPPTLSKLHHDKKTTLQECSKAKIFKHDQSHNDPKFQNNQMTIWSMGPRVFKKSIIIIPIKCWIIFFTRKSKKRRSLGGRSHLDAKKNGSRK